MKLTKEDLLVAAEAAEQWPEKNFFRWTTIETGEPNAPFYLREHGVPGIGCPALCITARHGRSKKISLDIAGAYIRALNDLYYVTYESSYITDRKKTVARRFRALAETL